MNRTPGSAARVEARAADAGTRGAASGGRRGFLWFWGPAICYMGLIFGLSAMSNPPAPPGHLSDKTAHFLEYWGLGLLLVRAVARARWTKPTLAMVASAVALAVFYAVSDEGHQYFVPGRQCDWRDALADTAGASTAAACVYAWGIIAAVFRGR